MCVRHSRTGPRDRSANAQGKSEPYTLLLNTRPFIFYAGSPL